jgi:cob(I)alamin adenosyltransferase
MKLYTKRGDDGSTDLFGGTRVAKDDLRVTAYGEIDETNAAVGSAAAVCADERIAEQLHQIQADLFVLGAELATPPPRTPDCSVGEEDVQRLEEWIDAACEQVPPLRNFILPGGTASAAALHVARAVCRRAERAVVKLSHQQSSSPWPLIYLNRLSDLLFALARLANHRAGTSEHPWVPERHP